MLSINNIIGSVESFLDTPDYIIFKVYKVYKVPPAGRFVWRQLGLPNLKLSRSPPDTVHGEYGNRE